MVERTVHDREQERHSCPARREIVKTRGASSRATSRSSRDDLEVNGKSIMGVMMLAAECGVADRRCGPTATTPKPALDALAAARRRQVRRDAEWTARSPAFRRRRGSWSARCTSCAGKCRRCRTRIIDDDEIPAEMRALPRRRRPRPWSACARCASASRTQAGPRGGGDLRRADLHPRGRRPASRASRSSSARSFGRREGVRHRDARVARSTSRATRTRCCASASATSPTCTSACCRSCSTCPTTIRSSCPRARAPSSSRTTSRRPHRAARPRGDRRHRDRRRHAHVARGDPRAVARPARRRRPAQRHRTRSPGGERVILDGTAGTLIVSPTRRRDRGLPRARAAEEVVESGARRLATLESVTLDGVRVTLRANVDLPEEAEAGRATAAPTASG